MKVILAIACSVSMLSNCYAEDSKSNSAYIDVGYSTLTYSDSGYDFTPSAGRIVLGKNTTDNLGIEGLLGFGITTSSKTISSVTYDLSIPSFYGIYGKVYTKLNDDLELFGRLGWAKMNRSFTYSSTTNDDSGSGASYGLGLKYSIAKNTTISADYMSYYPKKNTVGLSGYTIGVGFNF